MTSTSKILFLLAAAVLLVAAGFVAGMMVTSSGQPLFGIQPEKVEAPGDPGMKGAEDVFALRKRVEELEAQLETAKAGGEKPRGKPNKDGGKKKALSKAEWELLKKAEAAKKGKGKGKGKWEGKKDWKPGLPEGMTRAEQDQRIREIVDAHDWRKSAGALVACDRADREGRGISLPVKQTIGDLYDAIGELREVGVPFSDPRVARRFVPAMVSSLGANLDTQQTEQITQIVDQAAQRAENQPEPDPPLRYVQEKAQDIQRTLDLEQQMESILRPEQFLDYLAEVGTDPFRSGFAFKVQRMTCTGATADAVAQQVVNLWSGDWYGLEAYRAQIAPVAHGYVTEALALPVPDEGLEPAVRRRAILVRAKRILERQGAAEQALITSLPLSEEERSAVIGMRWPVLDLVIE
ncbi:MAG: hypothetical protein ACYTHN_14160 [Planctomycetota bacterium]|jgi:hypothetical protein